MPQEWDSILCKSIFNNASSVLSNKVKYSIKYVNLFPSQIQRFDITSFPLQVYWPTLSVSTPVTPTWTESGLCMLYH